MLHLPYTSYSQVVEIPPKTITATAPQDAPDEIPNMYGSAIGFFVTHCISTPQIARPAPQIAPSNNPWQSYFPYYIFKH